jgi:putative endonuclease
LEKGKGFEDIACEYLTSLGYRILHRNFYCRGGEIDIIALDGDVLVFVEVKGTTTN